MNWAWHSFIIFAGIPGAWQHTWWPERCFGGDGAGGAGAGGFVTASFSLGKGAFTVSFVSFVSVGSVGGEEEGFFSSTLLVVAVPL